MSFLIYLLVGIVTVFSVLLEMDVLVEPAHKVETAVTQQAPLASVVRHAGTAATDALASEPAPVPAKIQASTQAVSDKCDVVACAAAYQSFRASDCTFESNEGRRELCAKGVLSDKATAEAVLNAHADVGAASSANPQCNVAACSQAYISFKAADCTYQPLEGPRRLCAK